MKSPCNGCTERQFRCHGQCVKYKAFSKLCKEVGDAQKKDKELALMRHINSISAIKQFTHGANKTGRIKR